MAGGWRALGLLALNFLLAGVGGIINKWATRYGVPNMPNAPAWYQAVLFATTAVLAGGWMAWRRMRPDRAEMATGVVAGAGNAAATVCILGAMAVLPIALVLPAASAALITVNMLVGVAVWRERPVPRQIAGAVLAVAVVVLLTVRL